MRLENITGSDFPQELAIRRLHFSVSVGDKCQTLALRLPAGGLSEPTIQSLRLMRAARRPAPNTRSASKLLILRRRFKLSHRCKNITHSNYLQETRNRS